MSAADWLRERLADQVLFDQHCTPPQRLEPRLPTGFLARCFLPDALPEAQQDAPYTATYRLALRWLAELLDCDPIEQAVLDARAARSSATYARLLADDARLGPMCAVESDDEHVYRPAEWAELVDRPLATLLPIEPLAERLLPHCDSWDDLRTLFARALAEAIGRGARGLVSDFPLRTSLAIHPIDVATADRSFYEVRAEIDAGTFTRLEHRRLLYGLLWVALEVAAELTVPLHLTLGAHPTRDPHGDDPAFLRPLFDEPRYQHVPIVLVATARLHPHAVALARHYPHCSVAPGPAFLLEPAAATSILRDLLASVPTTRVLASTGGAFLPEQQWFVARLWRRALVHALGTLVDEDVLTPAEAETDASLVLAGNAQRLYRFPR
ncbi:MAG: hypothetical protein RMK01_08195 [Thermomicrobium sp.]|nr:hypothetical protein [Thermomicrobium sp.]